MTDTAPEDHGRPAQQLYAKRSKWAGVKEASVRYIALMFGLVVVGLIFWIGTQLYLQSGLTRHRYGWSLLTTSVWDVPHEVYGALPFIYGTVVSSVLALIIAVPFSLGAALFLSEIAPRWLATPIAFMIEMLAAIPSIIYGLWGFLFLCPFLQNHVSPWLGTHFGSIPLFAGPPVLTNMLAAGTILAIMVTPFVTTVAREIFRATPAAMREGALALGATKWETIRSVVLPGSLKGISGAVILGFGRAIGETMAVVMVIGNTPQIASSLLQSAYTMPALLANQFNEAYDDDLQRSALLEVALILFVVTLVLNALARGLLLFMSRRGIDSTSAPSRLWLERLGATAAKGIRYAGITALLLCVTYQVVHDVRIHGLRGLLSPLSAIVLVYVLIRFVTAATRGTPNWLRWRKLNNIVMLGLLVACAAAACSVLGVLLVYIFAKGLPSLHLHFFTELPRPPGTPGGGLKNAVIGTIELVGVAAAIGIPVGLMGGIYLAEFGRGRFGSYIRYAADVLSGIPSVVIGLFAYAAFVLPYKHFSAYAGGAALAIMAIPTIVRTTEEMLRLVPDALREGSMALGATHLKTIVRIVIPAARGGIVTGIMLAIARVAGETAPLLFTAFGSNQVNTKLSQPVSSLTMMIYEYATSPYDDWIAMAWAGAVVLLLLVLVVSLAARFAMGRSLASR